MSLRCLVDVYQGKMMKILTRITFNLTFILLAIIPHFVFANSELSSATTVALDNRDRFNSRAINFHINQGEYVIYESISDFNFSKIDLTLSQIDTLSSDTPLLLKQRPLISAEQYNSLVGYVEQEGKHWLYYLQSDSWRSNAKLFRAQLTDTANLAEPEQLVLPFTLSIMSNPSLVYQQGRYHLAFINSTCCQINYSASEDGINFSKEVTLPVTGAMPEISVFNDGVLLFSYQRAFATSQLNKKGKPIFVMKSRYMLSFDQGKSWQHEQVVSNSIAEIHDAFPMQRRDGNIDLYYSHSLDRQGHQLSLWRRCVNSKGEQGTEMLVADQRIGNIAKPNVYRRPNGKLSLLFSEQGEEIKNGSIQQFAVLNDDVICNLANDNN